LASRELRNIFGSSGWYKQSIPKINFRYQLSLTADTKNKRSFFVSTIVISRYKKLTTGVIINHFSNSEVHTNRASEEQRSLVLNLNKMVAASFNQEVTVAMSADRLWKVAFA
jgi:hypothetical protein